MTLHCRELNRHACLLPVLEYQFSWSTFAPKSLFPSKSWMSYYKFVILVLVKIRNLITRLGWLRIVLFGILHTEMVVNIVFPNYKQPLGMREI